MRSFDMKKLQVAVIMGSASDAQIAKKTSDTLDALGIDYQVLVASAHRTPKLLHDKITEFEKCKVKVYIAIAGMAAHLGGVIASMTVKPVIAVPVGGKMMGLDSLLSTVQMPPGIPLAVVAVDGGKNAAILSAQILALQDETIADKLAELRSKNAEKVESQNKDLEKSV
jgi:5-(carboxyamino)imidazole ribonucleotide mutase